MPSLRSLLKLFGILLITSILSSHAQNIASRPSEDEIKQAVKVLKVDPNLIDEQKINSLHWVDDKKNDAAKATKIPNWLRWIRNLFVWLAHTSRLLLWTVITVLVALVVIFLLRVIRNYQATQKISSIDLPKHVRDMDIRPENLPDDVGAAAWQLWEQNQQRAALALLYRGLLSRLVHVHAVPIKDSSTEAQCLELTRTHLQSSQTEYVSLALRVWQYAIYGAQLPDSREVQELCERFAAALNPVAQLNTDVTQ